MFSTTASTPLEGRPPTPLVATSSGVAELTVAPLARVFGSAVNRPGLVPAAEYQPCTYTETLAAPVLIRSCIRPSESSGTLTSVDRPTPAAYCCADVVAPPQPEPTERKPDADGLLISTVASTALIPLAGSPARPVIGRSNVMPPVMARVPRRVVVSGR